MGRHIGGLFYLYRMGKSMKFYVYVDESGTFDKAHNDLFIYGGLVVAGKGDKDLIERK